MTTMSDATFHDPKRSLGSTTEIQGNATVGAEMRRVLRPDGTLWLNLGDTFNTRTVIRPSSHQAGLGHDTESTRLSWAEARDLDVLNVGSESSGVHQG
jgi:hypothetical protein